MTEIIINEDDISSKILNIRGQNVMLDSDLAQVYNVETKALNRAVKRNIARFPTDFMFQLTKDEWDNLKYHFGTSSWGGRRTIPYVFTEHGAIMLASVLNSELAVKASISVVRAFMKLRQFVMLSREITERLEKFETKTEKKIEEHDEKFQIIFNTLKKIIIEEQKPKKKIGFLSEEQE